MQIKEAIQILNLYLFQNRKNMKRKPLDIRDYKDWTEADFA